MNTCQPGRRRGHGCATPARTISSAFILLIFTTMLAQGQLVVKVDGIADSKGFVVVALFPDQRSFLKTPVWDRRVKASPAGVTAFFDNLPPGQYGISVFHDRDDNGKINSNAIGIPTEGFGFGNNAMGIFGPPSFRKASVVVGTGREIHIIKLKYY